MMPRSTQPRLLTVALLMTMAGFAPAAGAQSNLTTAAARQWPLIERYCLDCHNDEDYSGGFRWRASGRTPWRAKAACSRRLSSSSMPA